MRYNNEGLFEMCFKKFACDDEGEDEDDDKDEDDDDDDDDEDEDDDDEDENEDRLDEDAPAPLSLLELELLELELVVDRPESPGEKALRFELLELELELEITDDAPPSTPLPTLPSFVSGNTASVGCSCRCGCDGVSDCTSVETLLTL
ncbi:hypothetical protein AGMMS49990_10180 [Endomicrobiia bacterium]|nr:hypothetical protein AGMMS49990_10180 [Endomicrobiia bacterium]